MSVCSVAGDVSTASPSHRDSGESAVPWTCAWPAGQLVSAACSSMVAKSVGPNHETTACTAEDSSALPRASSSKTVAWSPVAPSMLANQPPADCPHAPTCSGSRPYVAALARSHRTAAFTSWAPAGKVASPERR